ncbi:MAG: aminotransferase class I/II-fold pyridoxal phosphate-dependent enzyme [Leucobacter sp.]
MKLGLGCERDPLDEAGLRARGSLKWTEYPDAIGAFIAEMDFGIAPAVRRSLVEAAEAGMTSYLPAAVAARHAMAVSDWLRCRYGWAVPAERVRPVADVIACLELAILRFSAPDSPVIVPTPAYKPFLSVPRELGREVIEAPMSRASGRWLLEADVLERAFEAGGGLLILCNPANPVGTVYRRGELLEISRVVERHGGRVFADEVHAPLIMEPGLEHVPYASVSETAAGHAVTGTSAAKAWNIAGVKCAQFVLSNDADAETWQRHCLRAENGASVLGVVANTAAYSEGEEWLCGITEQLRENRGRLLDLLSDRLPEVRCIAPEGTYMAWLECGGLRLSGRPEEFFLERAGVALTGGAGCGAGWEECVRFNFAMPSAVLERAVDRMASAVAVHRIEAATG